MPTVELRDIETEDDVEAVMGLRRGPGQDRYLGSMISHFEDATRDVRACPRMWSVHDEDAGTLVGFVMISDDIPAETLARDPDVVGPYFLWRLLIDHRFQGRGYGRAAIDAVVRYVAANPNGDVLFTSCAAGDGSPQGFYLRYGFTPTGAVIDGEDVLELRLRDDRHAGATS
jgi:diamine N-acetyltransferase